MAFPNAIIIIGVFLIIHVIFMRENTSPITKVLGGLLALAAGFTTFQLFDMDSGEQIFSFLAMGYAVIYCLYYVGTSIQQVNTQSENTF